MGSSSGNLVVPKQAEKQIAEKSHRSHGPASFSPPKNIPKNNADRLAETEAREKEKKEAQLLADREKKLKQAKKKYPKPVSDLIEPQKEKTSPKVDRKNNQMDFDF